MSIMLGERVDTSAEAVGFSMRVGQPLGNFGGLLFFLADNFHPKVILLGEFLPLTGTIHGVICSEDRAVHR